jgi:hypothetical protein
MIDANDEYCMDEITFHGIVVINLRGEKALRAGLTAKKSNGNAEPFQRFRSREIAQSPVVLFPNARPLLPCLTSVNQ